MRNIMAYATEAELGGLFENYQNTTSMQKTLEEMVQPQPTTPVATYNYAKNSIVNGTTKKKYL